VTDPKVRLKYQQLITNSFVEVHFVIVFCDFRVTVRIAVKILHMMCLP